MLHTLLLPIDPLRPQPALIEQAAAVLRRGGLVAFPTETVYGLGANAFDAAAVGRIFHAKARPTSDPLIVHIAALEQFAQVAGELPALALQLAQAFWPGPLTLVLPRGARIPLEVTAGSETVAVRMPDHPIAFALIRAAGVPIAAPSANRFTRPSPTTAQHVLDDLDGRITLVIDGGPTRIGLESTVVSLVGPVPEVLRPGGVPIEALRLLLPNLIHQPRYLDAATPAAAPGMLLKHYAPDAEVMLFRGRRAAVLAHMHTAAQGQRTGVLAANEDVQVFADTTAIVQPLGSAENLAEVGANLFAGLRTLEQAGVTRILVRAFDQSGLGLAIWDRLLRATEGHVIVVEE